MQSTLNPIIKEQLGDHIPLTIVCMSFEMAPSIATLLRADLNVQNLIKIILCCSINKTFSIQKGNMRLKAMRP